MKKELLRNREKNLKIIEYNREIFRKMNCRKDRDSLRLVKIDYSNLEIMN